MKIISLSYIFLFLFCNSFSQESQEITPFFLKACCASLSTNDFTLRNRIILKQLQNANETVKSEFDQDALHQMINIALLIRHPQTNRGLAKKRIKEYNLKSKVQSIKNNLFDAYRRLDLPKYPLRVRVNDFSSFAISKNGSDQVVISKSGFLDLIGSSSDIDYNSLLRFSCKLLVFANNRLTIPSDDGIFATDGIYNFESPIHIRLHNMRSLIDLNDAKIKANKHIFVGAEIKLNLFKAIFNRIYGHDNALSTAINADLESLEYKQTMLPGGISFYKQLMQSLNLDQHKECQDFLNQMNVFFLYADQVGELEEQKKQYLRDYNDKLQYRFFLLLYEIAAGVVDLSDPNSYNEVKLDLLSYLTSLGFVYNDIADDTFENFVKYFTNKVFELVELTELLPSVNNSYYVTIKNLERMELAVYLRELINRSGNIDSVLLLP